MRPFDPLMGFGAPPPDAVTDEDALAGVMGHPPMPLFHDVEDIPRVEDANPWKNPDGTQKMTPRPEAMTQPPPPEYDGEAIGQAILDQATQERDNSRAFQAKVLEQNDAESQAKRKQQMGGV